MIEKVPEAKELMNALYLQVHMKGPSLNQGDIYNVIKFIRARTDASEATMKKVLGSVKKSCESDIKAFVLNVHENQRLEFTVQRHLSSNGRAISRVNHFSKYTTDEKNDYEGLRNLVEAGKAAWVKFNTQRFTDIKNAIALLKKKAISIVGSDENTAFVQLDTSSLSQIKLSFDQSTASLEGFRPVVQKLLELMATPTAVSKAQVRRKIRVLLRKIITQLRHRRDDVQAVNERALSIFDAVVENHRENLIRVGKLLERLTKELTGLNTRKNQLTDARTRAAKISKLSVSVFNERKRQCIAIGERVARVSVKIAKVRNILAQIAAILAERFGALKGYFLQKEMKLTN